MDKQRLEFIRFATHSPLTLELIAEIERLQLIELELESLRGTLRGLFGLDWQEGIKQFREVMEQA